MLANTIWIENIRGDESHVTQQFESCFPFPIKLCPLVVATGLFPQRINTRNKEEAVNPTAHNHDAVFHCHPNHPLCALFWACTCNIQTQAARHMLR